MSIEPILGGQQLTPITLVPVEVFGGDCDCHEAREPNGGACHGWSYGLSDAVTAWSDCNRAVGRIYRVDDIRERHCAPGETVTIHVTAEQAAFFERTWPENEPGPGVDGAAARRAVDDATEIERLRRRVAELERATDEARVAERR